MTMQPGKINMVMGGQWGSEAKGKLAGYLALRKSPYASVCNFLTNAGHWFRSKSMGDFLVQQLPMAAVNPHVKLLISAGSGITIKTLEKEIEQFESRGIRITNRLTIDPHAFIIEEKHKQEEAGGGLGRISSTLKGCGAALAAKVARKEDVVLVKDVPAMHRYGTVARVAPLLHGWLSLGYTIMGELAQGFDLSLNHGHLYPHVTSRDITPSSFLADIGVPPRYAGTVYAALRTFPIRVGHVYDDKGNIVGHSGPHYSDQTELTWDELSAENGRHILEHTTVTGKVRRVFSFSMLQLMKFSEYCSPNVICLQFCNYFRNVYPGIGYADLMKTECGTLIRNIERATKIPVLYLGTGADDLEMIDLTSQEHLDAAAARSVD